MVAGAGNRAAVAGPFVDSVIVVSKTFSPGSMGSIDVFFHNDSALREFWVPLVVNSQGSGAFGRVDSVKLLLSSLDALHVSSKVDGTTPDSLLVFWLDVGGGNPLPAGTRRSALRIFVTNNGTAGTYALDSNRWSATQFLKFTHPPTQPSVPVFVRGVELISDGLNLTTTQVTLFKGKDACVTMGGTLCDTTSQTLTIDSVRVQHSGDPDLLCSTAVGATNLVGKTLSAFSCATDSGNGYLKVCQAPTASIGDTGTCRITFFGTLPSEAGAPSRIVAMSAVVSMASGSAGATVVPTLTQWGLALFGVLLAGMLGYVYYLRRRRAARLAT
jgi:hypothetical protein